MKRKPHTSKEEKMQAYLFVHFKEKTTPDGEQVYFGLSLSLIHIWTGIFTETAGVRTYGARMGRRQALR